jgi:hypothetical protein
MHGWTDGRMHGCARLAPSLRWGTGTGGRRFGQGLAQPPATEASAQSATARCLKGGTLNGYNMHAFGATRVSVRYLKTAPGTATLSRFQLTAQEVTNSQPSLGRRHRAVC